MLPAMEPWVLDSRLEIWQINHSGRFQRGRVAWVVPEGSSWVPGRFASGSRIRPVGGAERQEACSREAASGISRASVLEIGEGFDTDTYRAVYTVKFEEAVYVLHCFQKKSKSGIGIPKRDLELVKQRYKQAEEEHQTWQRQRKAQGVAPVSAPSNAGRGRARSAKGRR